MVLAKLVSIDAQLLAQLETSLWIFDIDHSRVIWANPAALQVWKASSLEELQGRDLATDMTPAVADRLKQYQIDFEASSAEFREQWTLYPGGRPVSLNLRYCGYRLPDGRMAMLCEGRPISGDDPESLRSVEALLHTPMMIGLYSADGKALYRNPAARKAVTVDSVRLHDRFPDEQALAALLALAESRGVATGTLRTNTLLGERWHEVSVHRRRDAVTGDAALLVSEVDVTLLKQSEARALFLSEHDALTGLPNRAHAQRYFALLQDRAQHTSSAGQQIAVILIDVDNFKYVNDTWGHSVGDDLLKKLAQRLAASVRSTDLVARFGGDEFLMIVSSPDAHREVSLIHERLQRNMATPLALGDVSTRVFVTAGASICPDHGSDFDALLQHADLALYEGKTRGRNMLKFYQEGLGESLRLQAQLEDELRVALERQEFVLRYQPRVDADGSRVVGAEALVRWEHPRRGTRMPAEFIPACESSGLIVPLGRQVIEMAAAQLASWCKAGRALKVSVNLSTREFEHPELASAVRDAISRHSFPAHLLELEVTESMLMSDGQQSLDTLNALRALGVSIALDDFGTGYSNLAYLARFPFSVVKIDRSFVQAAHAERPLAEAVVAMCHAMNLRVVGEGIETEEQHAWLRLKGVQEFQGFLFGRPTDPETLNQQLDR